MKSGLTAIMVIMAGSVSLPAFAQDAAPQPVAVSADDLPLTARFATLLGSYRNCVLEQVDDAPLGLQQDMAKNAMQACALTRGELRNQLIADIQAQDTRMDADLAAQSADNGLQQVDPMIEAAAVDWAHVRYARNMI